MNLNQIEASTSKVTRLSFELSRSMKCPCSRTLSLIDRAIKLLLPFESPKAEEASPTERCDLLELLRTHRMVLCPYIDVDKIESNLRFQ